MSDPDLVTQRGRDQAARQAPNVKIQKALIGAALQGKGRAVISRREAAELHPAILAGKVAKRPRQFEANPNHVRRQANQIRHARRHRNLIRHRFNHELEIRDDPRLAGVDHVAALFGAAEDLAVDEAYPAGAANAASAVMRKLNAVHDRAVEQQITAISVERLLVQGHLANLTHYSTSTRIG